MRNCFMECKHSRKSNLVGDKRDEKGRCVRMVKKYHMKSQYDVFPMFSYQCQICWFQT